MLRLIITISCLFLFCGTSFVPSAAAIENISEIQPYLERVKDRIIEYKLDNGMKFIILPDQEAPVISFVTYADVGGANEEEEIGRAHV